MKHIKYYGGIKIDNGNILKDERKRGCEVEKARLGSGALSPRANLTIESKCD